MERTYRLIQLIGIGLILVAAPGIVNLGYEQKNLVLSFIEWMCYVGSLVAGVGLIFGYSWARVLAVQVSLVVFVWFFYMIGAYIGPQFSFVVGYFSLIQPVPPHWVGQFFLGLILMYLTIPLIFMLILTHPAIRRHFPSS